jgi:AcrR family transcriptional regulator
MERARKDEDKKRRRRAILDAARTELSRTRFQALQMMEVARRADLAKGTLYLYFETKEALALALLEELLEAWFDDLDAALEKLRRPTPRRVAELMLHTLEAHAPLARLLAILQSVLEHNISLLEARRFKERLLERVLRTGSLLERQLPRVTGARLILQANALVVGLSGMAEPAPVVAEVLAEPALSPLRIDFAPEFLDALEALASHTTKKGRHT